MNLLNLLRKNSRWAKVYKTPAIYPLTRSQFVKKFGAESWSEQAYQRYLSTLNKEMK